MKTLIFETWTGGQALSRLLYDHSLPLICMRGAGWAQPLVKPVRSFMFCLNATMNRSSPCVGKEKRDAASRSGPFPSRDESWYQKRLNEAQKQQQRPERRITSDSPGSLDEASRGRTGALAHPVILYLHSQSISIIHSNIYLFCSCFLFVFFSFVLPKFQFSRDCVDVGLKMTSWSIFN